MAESDAPTENLARLSPAQLVDALWADPQQRVYAVLTGGRIPGLRERLAKADVDHWDALWTGELDADERAAAPLLVTLRRGSAFGGWLFGQASASFPGWGVVVLTRLPFLAMRTHGRALCKAQLPNGQAIRIDWMDPEVMEALLPVAPADQLQRVFAGVDAMVTITPERWTRWSLQLGRLSRQAAGVLG